VTTRGTRLRARARGSADHELKAIRTRWNDAKAVPRRRRVARILRQRRSPYRDYVAQARGVSGDDHQRVYRDRPFDRACAVSSLFATSIFGGPLGGQEWQCDSWWRALQNHSAAVRRGG
jgi:hypothetical protein